MQAEHHLAEHQQLAYRAFAQPEHADQGRHQGQAAGDQAPLPAGNLRPEETLHHHLPGNGAGEGRALPRRQQGEAEQEAGQGAAHQRVEQVVGVLDLHHLGMAAAVESRGGEDQDRRIDQQRQGQRADGVEPGKADRRAFARRVVAADPGLHHGRMQVEVVRHHRRAEDADRQVQRLLAAQGVPGWPQAGGDIRPVGADQHQFDEETRADGRDQPQHYGLQAAEVGALQGQHDQGIEGGEDHPGGNRDAQQQVEGQRRAEHLGKVGGDDRQFRQQPLATRHARAIALPGELREVAAGGDPQARTEALQEHPGKARQHHHEQQRVAEARARLDGGGPVAGVHVADRDQQAGADEQRQLAQRRGVGRHRHAVADRRGTERRGGRGGQGVFHEATPDRGGSATSLNVSPRSRLPSPQAWARWPTRLSSATFSRRCAR